MAQNQISNLEDIEGEEELNAMDATNDGQDADEIFTNTDSEVSKSQLKSTKKIIKLLNRAATQENFCKQQARKYWSYFQIWIIHWQG